MHSQPPKSPTPLIRGERQGEKISSYLLPLSGELQGDFENFAKVGVIGKRLLIYLIHHNSACNLINRVKPNS